MLPASQARDILFAAQKSDMPAGVRGLYHIAPNKVRHIATEPREVISHSHSEYIAEQKREDLADISVLFSLFLLL